MRKFFLIVWFEYRRKVFTWRFLIKLLTLQMMPGLCMGVTALIFLFTANRQPVGYVDLAGVISLSRVEQGQDVRTMFTASAIQFQPYDSELAAQAALDAGKIQAYYVLPSDFRQTRSARVIYSNAPSGSARSQFTSLVRQGLLADFSAQRLNRMLSIPIEVWITVPQKAGEHSGLVLLRLALPVLVFFSLVMTASTCAGYLCRALIEEKAGRVIEVLVTSVSPNQLMLAKVSALTCVAMTEMGVLTALPSLALTALMIAGLSVSEILPFDLLTIVLLAVICLLTFLLINVVVILLSVFAKTSNDAEYSFMPVLMTMVSIPYCSTSILATQPDHWLTYFLSFFPLTSAFTLLCRLAFTTVPIWQMGLMSLVLLVASLALLWFTGRIFQTSMLQDRSRLKIRYLARIVMRGAE